STLPMQDIANAYNAQLEAAGWEAVDSEVGSRIARSGWTLKDMEGKSWAGTFTLTANPAVADQYTAQVTIQEIGAK
ncbi:MAG: hypothetical protein K8I30_07330, partial [Anaerolineae bacterium]|nr:hypothetical protein [Anaerolineae bacterium]